MPESLYNSLTSQGVEENNEALLHKNTTDMIETLEGMNVTLLFENFFDLGECRWLQEK